MKLKSLFLQKFFNMNILKHHLIELKSLMISPKKFWSNHHKTTMQNKGIKKSLFTRIYLPILLILATTIFFTEFFRNEDLHIEYAVGKSLRIIVLYILQYSISVFLTNELISSFKEKKNIEKVKQLIVYSMIPFFAITFVVSIFPVLYFLNILGAYAFFLFYLGTQELFDFEERNEIRFVLLAIVMNFFTFNFLNIILWKIFNAITY